MTREKAIITVTLVQGLFKVDMQNASLLRHQRDHQQSARCGIYLAAHKMSHLSPRIEPALILWEYARTSRRIKVPHGSEMIATGPLKVVVGKYTVPMKRRLGIGTPFRTFPRVSLFVRPNQATPRSAQFFFFSPFDISQQKICRSVWHQP